MHFLLKKGYKPGKRRPLCCLYCLEKVVHSMEINPVCVVYFSVVVFDCLEIIHKLFLFFFQAEDGIRGIGVTGVQTCALPIFGRRELHLGRAWWRCESCGVGGDP